MPSESLSELARKHPALARSVVAGAIDAVAEALVYTDHGSAPDRWYGDYDSWWGPEVAAMCEAVDAKAKARLRNLLTDGWVRVEDALPSSEPPSRVLATDGRDVWVEHMLPCYWGESDPDGSPNRQNAITHWQPAPALPGGEETEDVQTD